MSSPSLEDKELIERCLALNRAAQEELYRKYADDMYNVCLLYTSSEDDACDILQDAFVKVFRKLETFHFDCPIKHWIRRIVVNTALDLYRKKKREKDQEADYHQNINYEVDDIIPNINAADIVNMVTKLPHKAALVLKLYILEGYSHKEIGDMLSISEGTSKSQLNRARSLLKELIIQHHGA